MDEIFDYIPLIGDVYRGWRLGTSILSFFSDDDETDAILVQMYDKIILAINEENIDKKIIIIDEAYKLSEKTNCEKKYQQVILGYTLMMGSYIGVICYWQRNVWNLEAKKELDKHIYDILSVCYKILDINITWLTDNADLVKDVQSRTSELVRHIKETRREMHKHFRHVDKVLHPWKYRLIWIIPLAILLFTALGIVCDFYL